MKAPIGKINKSDYALLAIYAIIAIPVSLFDYSREGNWLTPFLEVSFFLVITISCAVLIAYYIFPYFFSRDQYIRMAIVTCFVIVVCGYLENGMYNYFGDKNWDFTSLKMFYWSFLSMVQNVGILLGLLLGKKYVDSQINIGKMEVEMKESELRLLKSQVDPHFLFNNLNTVDSMIDTDPAGAKKYLHTLSNLYRYLTTSKDEEVVILEDELIFARDYQFLITKRFGDLYQFKLTDNSTNKHRLIPPASIQTLLENAVKHNGGSVQNPVIIETIINDNSITVKNNLVPKYGEVVSTKQGLSNLTKRYKFLTDQAVETSKTNNTFTVTLPLIQTVD